jgi:hypothetical protein
MHFTTVALATLLALTAAKAVPSMRSNMASLTKRDEKTWDAKGNLKLVCTFPLIPLMLLPFFPSDNS